MEDDKEVEGPADGVSVDWSPYRPPNPELAAKHRLCERPVFILDPTPPVWELRATARRKAEDAGAYMNDHENFKVKKAQKLAHDLETTLADLKQAQFALANPAQAEQQLKRVPFDRSAPRRHDADPPKQYPLWGTSMVDLGAIGGVGLRLYFLAVKFLAFACFAMGIATLPALSSNQAGSMFDQAEAERFQSTIAETTLGNVRADPADIAQGKVPSLFVASETDALATLLLLAMLVFLRKEMKKTVNETDSENITMADYTVQIAPVKLAWPKFASVKQVQQRGKVGGDKLQEFHSKLKLSIEGACSPSSTLVVAQLPKGEDAIWSAWDEDENIQLWERKIVQLKALEQGLKKAAAITVRTLQGLLVGGERE